MIMKVKYITIEREYGSGGTQIARTLSRVCEIPCYGKEILEEIARKYDISVDEIQKYEENTTSSFLYSIYTLSCLQSGRLEPLTAEGRVFVAEQEAIRNLSMKGKAIFLGHCAAEVLKEQSGVIKVFIRCSDLEEKKKRIVHDYGIPATEAESIRKRFDRKRNNYYVSNTGRKWHDPANYDVLLDSAKLGIDGCVDLLKGLIKNEEKYL